MSLGFCVYILAIAFRSLHSILLSQFIIGFGAGSLGVTRSYVAMITTKENRRVSLSLSISPSFLSPLTLHIQTLHRAEYMAYLTAFQYCGFAVSPILGAMISYRFTKDLAPKSDGSVPQREFVNEFSSPAMALIVVSLLCIALLHYCFTDIEAAKVASPVVPSEHVELEASPETVSSKTTSSSRGTIETIETNELLTPPIASEDLIETKWMGITMVDRVTLGCCMLNVTVRGAVGIFETLVLSYAIAHYNWSSMSAGITVSICGIFGVIILLNFSALLKVRAIQYIPPPLPYPYARNLYSAVTVNSAMATGGIGYESSGIRHRYHGGVMLHALPAVHKGGCDWAQIV